MPDHSAFNFTSVTGRSMVQWRVRPAGAEAACKALGLPDQALRWESGDPAVHWLGADLWLLTSDEKSAGEIIRHIGTALKGQLNAATDMSSAYVCFSLRGPAARKVLAMGCGIDMHESAFKAGHCTRTHFANLLLFIVAVEDDTFDLYVDRSMARYLGDWIASASEDPITQDLNYSKSSTERT